MDPSNDFCQQSRAKDRIITIELTIIQLFSSARIYWSVTARFERKFNNLEVQC